MDQGSSSKEEIQGNVFQISCSRSTFVEVFNALLRCLGFGTVDHQTIIQDSSSTSSSAQEDDEKASGESPQFPTPTSTTSDPQADPPMDTPQADDPPMDTSEDDPSADAAPSALLRRTPPVSTGGGGQINSTTS